MMRMRRHREQLPAPAIIIMGVSGSGKSTLAALLAEQYACPFLEGDTYHSEANVAKMRRGEPLTDDDRWPWLDQLGTAIGTAALAEGRAVAACSALKRVYRDRLCAAIGLPTRFILLHVSREELTRRLTRRTGHYMPASLLDSQLALLEMPDADEPALTLEGTLPAAEMLNRAIAWLDADQPMAARSLG
jgi:gluconokinase